jgi:carbamate kinase
VIKTALIAVGGNSLIRPGEKGTVAEQLGNAERTARAVVKLVADGVRVVLTHGNGPQVGAALLRSERAAGEVYDWPLDVCDSGTQGEIGYYLQQSLHNALADAGLDVPVATVLTQVVVSPDDPALKKPTKPVGPFYSKSDAEERAARLGWTVVEDAARGWRRVVPSPEPIDVVEEDVIRRMLGDGVLVIAAGGGGIPVVRDGARLRGIEAVIDKDRASAVLAARLGVDMLIISTAEPNVFVDYKKPTQRVLGRVTAAELEALAAAGQFPPGSMGPKVESVLRFVRARGGEALITSYEHLADAIHGSAGTRIVPAPGGAS